MVQEWLGLGERPDRNKLLICCCGKVTADGSQTPKGSVAVKIRFPALPIAWNRFEVVANI